MGWKFAFGLLLLAIVSLGEETNQVKTLAKGTFSGIQEPTQTVVTNQAQWTDLWAKHVAQKTPQPPAPEVNFDKETVIFVTLGRKNSGGYGVEITGVRRSGNTREILVSTTDPKPGGLTIQALTAPFHIVAVPRLQDPVKFKVVPKKRGG